MVESAVPTGESIEPILKAILTFINTNTNLREHQVAKQTVSKLTLGARVNHRLVNEFTRDLDRIKMDNERLRFQVKQLERRVLK